jgi:hypothetical protein
MALFAHFAVATQLASRVWTHARRINIIHTQPPQTIFDTGKFPLFSQAQTQWHRQ